MPKKTIPDFQTEKEEHEFWLTQSSLDYEMEDISETILFDRKAKTKLVSIRMPIWLIDDLKAIAADEGISYQRLVKECLKKFVEIRKQDRKAS